MTPARRKSSRKRMESRLRGRTAGASTLFTAEVPPKAVACNRAARRELAAQALKHEILRSSPIRKIGQDRNGTAVYVREDSRSRYVPARAARK